VSRIAQTQAALTATVTSSGLAFFSHSGYLYCL